MQGRYICRSNLKPKKLQVPNGKLPADVNIIDGISIEIAGPFKITLRTKNYFMVSIDNERCRPEAKFVRKPTTNKV